MSLEEHASVCTFDCPDTCSLTVTVDDGRITKVRGSDAMPFTDGVICSKVARDMTAFVHGPQRLLHPLRRVGANGVQARSQLDDELDILPDEPVQHFAHVADGFVHRRTARGHRFLVYPTKT